MRRIVLAIIVAFAAAVLLTWLFAPAGEAKAPAKETAVVEFPEKVKFKDVFLKGEYVFVHDEARMKQGHACLYVYTSTAGQPGDLVTSFHCERIERRKADRFTVVTARILPDLTEVLEVQFAGSADGHRIPRG